jgi:cytoskeletal protein CcmA (bactofilin family)
MALFNNKGGKEKAFSSATIVTDGTTNIGKFVGNDSIHIDGYVEGDVKVNNIVVIGKNGVVNGDIKAQQVISSGSCKGYILCDVLELLETSKTEALVKSNKILIKGDYKGNITCSGLFVGEDALVESNVQAKSIVVNGTIIGSLACKVLKIMPNSCLRGKMFADRIINQGGHVEGIIGKYSDLLKEVPQLREYGSIFNSSKNVALLSHSDYYVDVKKEIENRDSSSADKLEDDFCDVEFEIKDESKLFEVA